MIFADKLIHLRKKSGWSQEELADKMNVTRQSISKWEGAQSIPDIEKILRLSQLFGVSTDFLLKDEIDSFDGINILEDESETRQVNIEEAGAFLKKREKTSKLISLGILLCIVSPICLIILATLSEAPLALMAENIASGIGLIVLFLIISTAVGLFIYSGIEESPYSYLEKEYFQTGYGVSGLVKEREAKNKKAHQRDIIIGTGLCISAVIPLFIGVIINEDNEVLTASMISVMLFLIGFGVMLLSKSGILWDGYEMLLQEGDYTKEEKEKSPIKGAVYTAYWVIATAAYVGFGLITNNWSGFVFIWAVAGILFPAVIAITGAIAKRKKK